MGNLFVYGTLMNKNFFSSLVQGQYRNEAAMLLNFQRVKIKGQSYPTIVPSDENLQGIVYFDISPMDMFYLDQYEGELYEKIPQKVLVETQEIEAMVYMVKSVFDHKIDYTSRWFPPTEEA